MTARILDGKALAQRVRQQVAADAAALRAAGVTPGLAVVLVGDDPASQIYVRNKHRAAEACGVATFDHKPPADISQDALLALVDELNADDRVDGILVQLPLPRHLDPDEVLDRIRPDKDVDGFHPDNIGRLAQNRPRFVAATPKGCMRLLQEAGCELAGANAVIVGRSNIVGKPMALLLTNAHATVTVCHSRTRDLAAEVARADVVIAAAGSPGLIRGAWIRPGATVIDVGTNRTADGKLVGDVEFEAARARAAAITPVPGGVGPMTIASLLENTVRATRLRRGPAASSPAGG
ncbi:MAG: bifunctional methylenetetrahydrofolate dehydrogenase/methenyltetrahydrofolate cyclohydrolase FolD [Deltaproteobacteria bacterium]|nr:MAG: bifunctional methylenetetrahydrofolate dehydrogenase/methenyltetrahydrofolate cyclohydrolase FolD [Deltaproteobacteria bacterium]